MEQRLEVPVASVQQKETDLPAVRAARRLGRIRGLRDKHADVPGHAQGLDAKDVFAFGDLDVGTRADFPVHRNDFRVRIGGPGLPEGGPGHVSSLRLLAPE